MRRNDARLAKKYAQAFLVVFGDKLPVDFRQQLEDYRNFWSSNQVFVACLGMGHVLEADKKLALDTYVFKTSERRSFWLPLVTLLSNNGRMPFFGNVVIILQQLYEEKTKIVTGSFESYPLLSEDQQKNMREFFYKKTGYTITGPCRENAMLIAGIRMQGAFFLWERSIKKRMNALRRLI
ncbi:MAG: hypothetical protein UU47_C0007G0010 [candidate division TM6 bacterium GW2011_GWE2_41_16]|nr:MAG: hypothetical protein UU47_C0007G0010 [candidate division TM6 bacterium GW2011_GWE2_41_16]